MPPQSARPRGVIRVTPAAELAHLGQHFADLERQQFGTDEFTAMVSRVAGIERELGIYDLNQFTPQICQYMPREGTPVTRTGTADTTRNGFGRVPKSARNLVIGVGGR